MVCVISESMAPTFHRGDILLLWNRTSTIEVGDIPVVWFEDSHMPMVHRVIKVHSFSNSEYGNNTALADYIYLRLLTAVF